MERTRGLGPDLGSTRPSGQSQRGTRWAWHPRNSGKCPHLNVGGWVPGRRTSRQEILMCPRRDLIVKYRTLGRQLQTWAPSERRLALYFAINIWSGNRL